MAAMRPVRHVQLDQENAGVLPTRRGLKTPGHAGVLGKSLSNAGGDGRNRGAQTVKEASRTLGKSVTATDIGPQRLFKETLTTGKRGLLVDKTNKTPHPSTRRPEAGPSKPQQAPTPEKKLLQKAQLVPSPAAPHLSPVAAAKPDYSAIKTPSPNLDAKRRGEAAPYTPPDFAVPEKAVHPADARRAAEWETLEEQEVEWAAGPSAKPFEIEEEVSELSPEEWKALPSTLRSLPFTDRYSEERPEAPFEEWPMEQLVEDSDEAEFLTDEESEDEPATPPPQLMRMSGALKGKEKAIVPAMISKSRSALAPAPRTLPVGNKAAASRLPSAQPSARSASAASARMASASAPIARRPASAVPSAHSRAASSTSTASAPTRRVPSFMAPTAASLAKQPPVSPRNATAPTSKVPAKRQAPASAEVKAPEELFDASEYLVGTGGRRRRPIFGPPTERKAKELAEREQISKEINQQLASMLDVDLPDDPFSEYFDVALELDAAA